MTCLKSRIIDGQPPLAILTEDKEGLLSSLRASLPTSSRKCGVIDISDLEEQISPSFTKLKLKRRGGEVLIFRRSEIFSFGRASAMSDSFGVDFL